jgi:excisionase family DNA binding protein
MTERAKRLYSRQQAADYLGKSLRAVDYLIADSQILAKKDGRRTVIDVAELDRYIERLPSLVPGRSA